MTFIEMKVPGFPKKASSSQPFSPLKHQDQLVQYVKEVLGRHASIASLPFVLFNGISFFVGVAEWLVLDSTTLKISIDPAKYNCFDRYEV